MKETIITLNNKEEYYVLEELNYNKKKYICTVPYDREKDFLNDENYYILEVIVKNDKLEFNDIEEPESLEITAKMFEKIRNNNN